MEKYDVDALIDHITKVEETNCYLLNTLRHCAHLLSLFKDQAEDKEGIQDILHSLYDIIQCGTENQKMTR